MRMTVAFSVLCMAGTISLSAHTSIKAAGNVETAEQLVSTKATGTAPLAVSSPRFTDNGNGTVTDGDTGLIYLRNASCAALAGTDVDGLANWSTAQAAAEALSEGTCGLTDGSLAGDWRLPTKEEWEGILKSSCDFDPEIVGNGTPTSDCYSTTSDGSAENGWASGVESFFYWSSSSNAGNPRFAWLVAMGFGSIDGGYRVGKGYVWPVRGGQ